MKPKSYLTVVWIIAISLLSYGTVFSQGFQFKKISDKVLIISNPDLGDQVVVQTEKGLVVFDSFWSEKTALMFKEEISKTMGRNDFSYVINMVDRLDLIGGNTAYPEAKIVGQENILTKYSTAEPVKEELAELIAMWREKESYSRERLKNFKEGSEETQEERNWMNKCITMADELENSFSLVLPDIAYNDRITIDMGNMHINLFWFGKEGNYQGLTMAVIPEEKLAIISKSIVYPEFHIAPYPFPYYGELDVPRWISMLEKVLEGENPVDNIILSDSYEVYSREFIHGLLDYIRKLWNNVKDMEAEGKTLPEIQDQLSIDKDFAFVKEMQVYKTSGDNWIRPQHEMHIKLFFMQGKPLASEIIKEGGPESLQTSLDKIRNYGNDIYFDEMFINQVGYEWMNSGHVSEAIEVFKLNTEVFPESSNVYDSLGEAYMKNGDSDDAIKNFKKSLELNPENRNAQEMLKKLETR